MGKLGFVGVFVIVAIAHYMALQSYVKRTESVSKPKVKVQRITLSSVMLKKPVPLPPVPKVEPIILPPDPEPVVEVIEKPKPKRIMKKRPVKKPVKKVIEKVDEVIEEIIPELPPVEQVKAAIKTVDTASIKDQYTSEIRRKIQRNLYYPPMAKRLRMEDIVQVSFRILQDGSIVEISIRNDPKSILKNAAIKTLKSISLEPIPKALGESFMDVLIPIEFTLRKKG